MSLEANTRETPFDVFSTDNTRHRSKANTRTLACVRACVRACELACVRACARACVLACVRACARACVLACVRCVRACVRGPFHHVRRPVVVRERGAEYVHVLELGRQPSADLHTRGHRHGTVHRAEGTTRDASAWFRWCGLGPSGNSPWPPQKLAMASPKPAMASPKPAMASHKIVRPLALAFT
eukprot:6197338-Pleurochrysis_carterae.AAC.1